MKKVLKPTFKRASYRLILFSIFGLYIPLLLIWSSLVIHYTFHNAIRLPAIFIYTLGSLGLLLFHSRIEKAVQLFSGMTLVITLWFVFIPASNDRNWAADTAVLPLAEIEENNINIKGFRHFDYENKQVKESFIDKSFDLDKLIGTDIVISYWDNFRSIGHTLVCFRFEDGQNISISLEVRREVDEDFHPAKGIFKQYELIYVIGDERDLIPLRTKIRHEETFLYPMNLNIKHSKLFLLDILKSANQLHESPRFYHSIGQNCTTTLIDHLNKVGDFNISLTTKVLLNGISDYYAYQLEGIPTDLPFEVLKRSCYISDIANELPMDQNFSTQLRKIINERLDKERKANASSVKPDVF